jgi:hypothetical protein
MKKLILVLLGLFLMNPALMQSASACGVDCGGGGITIPMPTLTIEFAPVFASDKAGDNQSIGAYFTVFSAPFNIGPPTPNAIATNTGIYSPLYTPIKPTFFLGNIDYWIKAQTGGGPGNHQMGIQLEGSSKGTQGGMADIIQDGLAYAAEQPVPNGKIFFRDQVRIEAQNLPFASDPTILTNSRLQKHLLVGDFDPATNTFPPNEFSNVLDDDGFVPIVKSAFNGPLNLDVWFDFAGSDYAVLAKEDSAVKMVTFFNGDFPLASGSVIGGGGGGAVVPEPATMLLLGSGLIGLAGYGRKKFFKK